MNLAFLRFWIPVAAFVIANLVSQFYYVERSRGVVPGSFTEAPFISNTHALAFLANHKAAWPDTVFTDSLLVSSGRLQSYYVNPSRMIFLSADHYDSFGSSRGFCVSGCPFIAPVPLFDNLDEQRRERRKYFVTDRFNFFPNEPGALYDAFQLDGRGADSALRPDTKIIESVRESVLNRWPDVLSSSGDMYRLRTLAESANHLVLVPASLGGTFDFGNGRISMYSLEPDLLYTGSFAGLGRYLLFRALSPTKRPRLELSISATLKADGAVMLPKAAVVGRRRVPLPLVGRGAARVFSDVVAPQELAGMRFFGLDMGEDERPIIEPVRKNLMKLYGAGVRLDPRSITVFGRDISVVDDEAYRRLATPQNVSRFPDDLRDPNLEFSGIYEDGWASEDSYFVLRSTESKSTLRVRGLLPLVGNEFFQTDLCPKLDGRDLECRTLSIGTFTYSYQLPKSSTGKHKIELRFSHYQVLQHGDQRPLGMKIRFIGFERT